MSTTYFLMWNIIGSIVFIILILIYMPLKSAEQEKERKREELRKKKKVKERELKEEKEIKELLLDLSINESQVVRELVKNSRRDRLVYENYLLGIYMFEFSDNSGEKFYVIYDWKYSCYYYNWYYIDMEFYYITDILKIVEYHRGLRE